MTSAVSQSAQIPNTAAKAAGAASDTTTPLSGAVPAQLPVRSYANATKTATQTPPVAAGASAQNARSNESSMNGVNPMAQGGFQAAVNGGVPNGTHAEHGRKPSVVISASGASGYTPNGGPVGHTGSRPPIHFGALNPHGSPMQQNSVPQHSQSSSLPAPSMNPRVISPAHSPSPIPQPQASGGRPPSSLQSQGNGLNFGSMPGEGEQLRQTQMPSSALGPGMQPMHERRTSSNSMQSDMTNPSMQNMSRGFASNGRSRPYSNQQFPGQMQSPGQSYRQVPSAPRANPSMAPAFQQQTSGSPFGRGNSSGSPAQPRPPQPHMPSGHLGGNPQMQYGGYPQHMYPQQAMYNMQSAYDAHGGYYNPYQSYGQYPSSGPPPSPRPYPSPFSGAQGQVAPPFHPPDMSRSASQSSQRPPSSVGQPQTPALTHPPPQSHTPANHQQGQQAQSSNFVRPVKKSAIKITDAQGNELNFGKPAASTAAQTPAQTPVIVSTPNAPTPPPRAPSSQHLRTENKTVGSKSAEETKTAFQEQVKRQMEEEKRKKDEDVAAKAKAVQDEKSKAEEAEKAEVAQAEQAETAAKVQAEKAEADAKAQAQAQAQKAEADAKAQADAEAKAKSEAEAKAKADAEAETTKRELAEADARNVLKEAAAEAEKAAAIAAKDKEAVDAAEAAKTARAKDEAGEAKDAQEETEDERIEREIAEMEAAEREEEERERAYNEKRQREKEAAAKRQAEKDANADAELKRQEREAEEREEARERERAAETEKDKDVDEPDEEAKSLFASLKKPTLGPGASAPESGAETPTSEDAPEVANMPPPAQLAQARTASGPKSKPAALKLETSKRAEPAEPTPGMQALRSARFLDITEEAKYPDGYQSPNPALNVSGSRKGRAYDKEFLLQFQNVFKEKPSVDWDQKVKETLGPGDEPGSARVQSGTRTPGVTPRQPSGRPAQAIPSFSGPMGTFGGQPIRTLPPGTTSHERFMASSGVPGRPGAAMPAAAGRIPSGVGMGTPGVGMSRTNSVQTMAHMGGPNSPRQPSARGPKGGSKRGGDRAMSKREEADMASKMPLTAHMEVAPLEKSQTGWKPTSITQPAAAGPDLSGHMAPDMVQRKVKAALNKMTPEKFDKISDQILEIAGQSKSETDGRTLRQVIQLTFEKACDEAHWAGMYAQFCHKMLTTMSTDIRDETITDKNGNPVLGGALFRKYLLNRCQEEFERGWQANLPDKPEGETQEAALLSDEYYVAAAAKRRGLGLIQFIGQLYKLRMLTIRIMHECVLRLLNFEGPPDESAIENLTTLLRAVGATMDEEEQGRALLTTYFKRIDDVLLKSDELASRPRFMILDLVDLRKAHWKGKGDDSKGPKTLDQIHQEAAAAQAKAEAERQRTSQRGGPGGGRMPQGRGDARNFSGNMAPPVDYTRTTVGMDDLRKLQNRGASQRQAGGSLAPGGTLGPAGALSARTGSRRGNLAPPSSGNTTRTNTPPVADKDKKDEPTPQSNSFSALAALDPAGEGTEEPASQDASAPSVRNRSKSPATAEKQDEATTTA